MSSQYCVKCKSVTDSNNVEYVMSKNNRRMMKSTCAVCGGKKTTFVKSNTGGDIASTISKYTSNIKLPGQKFPGEIHLPGMNFAGPGTRLDIRLNNDLTPKDWSRPVDRVDNAAYHHDLAYTAYEDTPNRNIADREMLRELNNINHPTLRERIEMGIIKPIIGTKARFGLGTDSIKKKI